MELADPKQISQLMDRYNSREPRLRQSNPRMTQKHASDAPVYHAPSVKSRRCRCGTCVTCKDNARWERIFTEKFADPTYYSGLAVRHESPINAL
jgi:hypothetical protein